MKIEKTYKYRLNNIVYVGASIPDDSELIEIMDILTAENGSVILRKSDNKKLGSSIWLKDGDLMENYEEVEIIKSEVENANNE